MGHSCEHPRRYARLVMVWLIVAPLWFALAVLSRVVFIVGLLRHRLSARRRPHAPEARSPVPEARSPVPEARSPVPAPVPAPVATPAPVAAAPVAAAAQAPAGLPPSKVAALIAADDTRRSAPEGTKLAVRALERLGTADRFHATFTDGSEMSLTLTERGLRMEHNSRVEMANGSLPRHETLRLALATVELHWRASNTRPADELFA